MFENIEDFQNFHQVNQKIEVYRVGVVRFFMPAK